MPAKAQKPTRASRAVPSPLPILKRMGLVIPTYKNKTTIGQTLDSILAQPAAKSLGAIVVCEDCGGDGTYEIVAEKLGAMANGKLLSNAKNCGEAATMMTAIAALPHTVEWLLVMHGDDYARPDWIETMARAVAEASPQVGIVCASYDWISGDSIHSAESSKDGNKVSTFIGPENIPGTLKAGCWWHISGAALHRRTYLDLAGRDPKLPHFGDWDLVLRLFRQGGGISYIPRSLTVYRENSESVSTQSVQQMKDVAEKLIVLDRFQSYLSFPELAAMHWQLLRRVTVQGMKYLLKLNLPGLIRAPNMFLRVIAYSVKFLIVRLIKVV